MHDNQRQTHWAYMAGIMDADGAFMITSHKRKTRNKETIRAKKFPKNVENWAITYMQALKVAMVEIDALEFFKNTLNLGNIYLNGVRASRPNNKPIYMWYLRKIDDVIYCLQNIIPYLKVKKERAEFLLDFCNKRKNYKNPCYRGICKDELEFREYSYNKMRELNGTKVAATTKPSGLERVSDSLNS